MIEYPTAGKTRLLGRCRVPPRNESESPIAKQRVSELIPTTGKPEGSMQGSITCITFNFLQIVPKRKTP
jgi:hypothetical protein